MAELKEIIAENIVKLRTSSGLTQLGLAEKLAYSDKAVSKWERAESLPDVAVIKQIADMFGVTVDWLLCPHTDDEKAPDTDGHRLANRKRIALLSVLGVWFAAVLAFVIMLIACEETDGLWLAFVAAVPLSAIILIVFNSIWGRIVRNMLYISILIWSLIAFIFLLIMVMTGKNLWMLFLIGIPLEAAVIIWHRMYKKSK